MITLNTHLQQRFGAKLYKLSLNGNMTCPNRDGTCGTRGCIFCSAGGSGEFAAPPDLSVTEQIEVAKKRVEHKCKSGRYIAYFQAFTNTYAPTDRLRQLFTEAIVHPDIAILSVATRPDCLPQETLDLLAELNRIKPVWVELGLQTVHQTTADLIRRGYDLACFEQAVAELRKRKIEVVVHIILGLPNETRDMMMQTAEYLAKQDIQGIKIQLLHILKGTDLADLYRQGKVQTLDMGTYFDLAEDVIRRFPSHTVLHRVTGDGPKNLLIAPLWSANKRAVLNAWNERCRKKGIL